MIISRTPFRISFFGGGTDYPEWYLKNGGSVLSTSIDKYCYISCRSLPPFFEHRIRVVYSKIEQGRHFDEIQHPAVRETLRFLKIEQGLEIHHDGDLPARSGMGSSSSFTVGLLHALYAYRGMMPSKKQLALESIHIEQNLIKEVVGSQDQVCVAFGGLNKIDFAKTGLIEVQPITLSAQRLCELESHLMLFYTGIERTASEVAKDYVRDIETKSVLLRKMQDIVQDGVDILSSNKCICRFGELLNETWMLKKRLACRVSNDEVDQLYEAACQAGAIGGKITGAGGGGFLLLFVPPSAQGRVRDALADRIHVPFKFDLNGSQIIFYEPEREDYTHIERDREKRTISSFRELEIFTQIAGCNTACRKLENIEQKV